MKTVKAKPNQSMADIILMQYGSLEAAMSVMAANDTALSYAPAVGSEWSMPVVDGAKVDKEVLAYLAQHEAVIGTLSLPALDYAVVLKPVMMVVPALVGPPHPIGYYQYTFQAAPGFVNIFPLLENYLSDNKVFFQTEERYALGYPYAVDTQDAVTPMSAKTVPYKLSWTIGNGYMMVWSDLTSHVKTVTFRDIDGNEAYVAPLLILDNVSQNVIDYLIADINIELISASSGAVLLRLTRRHPAIFINDFREHTMYWLDDAAGGAPDPDDPLNTDKTIVTLAEGKYTFGVKTTYQFNLFTPPIVFPSSAFNMVVSIG